MNDFKSKLPDFKEFSSMATKLFKDVKASVCEIIEDYKKNDAEEAAAAADEAKAAGESKAEAKSTEVHVEKKTETPVKEDAKATPVKAKKKEAPKKEEPVNPDNPEANKD